MGFNVELSNAKNIEISSHLSSNQSEIHDTPVLHNDDSQISNDIHFEVSTQEGLLNKGTQENLPILDKPNSRNGSKEESPGSKSIEKSLANQFESGAIGLLDYTFFVPIDEVRSYGFSLVCQLVSQSVSPEDFTRMAH